MNRLAAVRFNNVNKFYYFSTGLDLHKGDRVVVETVRGLELGELIADLKDLSEFSLNTELKPIKRLANRADLEIFEINKIKAEKSFETCKKIIAEFGLEMRLINCEYTLDASKVIFMYTADERVDFRELLKKLASVFKCRIELNQIGPRDKAKIVGGLGNCGLPLCCSSFLGEFDGVSINMAKNQLLAINIDKISGLCGRLLCCLKYEDEAYTQIKKKFPKIGSFIAFDGKNVKVVGLNVISDLVKIDDAGSISFVTLEEVQHGSRIEKTVVKEEPQETEEKPPVKKKRSQKQPKKDRPARKKDHAEGEETNKKQPSKPNQPKNTKNANKPKQKPTAKRPKTNEKKTPAEKKNTGEKKVNAEKRAPKKQPNDNTKDRPVQQQKKKPQNKNDIQKKRSNGNQNQKRRRQNPTQNKGQKPKSE